MNCFQARCSTEGAPAREACIVLYQLVFLGCQLAFSVRAVRASKNARFSTDVVQSNETEKTMLPLVFDDDDDGHTWLGDPHFLSASGLQMTNDIHVEHSEDADRLRVFLRQSPTSGVSFSLFESVWFLTRSDKRRLLTNSVWFTFQHDMISTPRSTSPCTVP